MPNLIVIFISSLIAVIFVEILEFAIKKVVKMAKMGRPTDNPKTESLHLRLTKDESELIAATSEKLELSKTETIMKGIKLLNEKM